MTAELERHSATSQDAVLFLADDDRRYRPNRRSPPTAFLFVGGFVMSVRESDLAEVVAPPRRTSEEPYSAGLADPVGSSRFTGITGRFALGFSPHLLPVPLVGSIARSRLNIAPTFGRQGFCIGPTTRIVQRHCRDRLFSFFLSVDPIVRQASSARYPRPSQQVPQVETVRHRCVGGAESRAPARRSRL